MLVRIKEAESRSAFFMLVSLQEEVSSCDVGVMIVILIFFKKKTALFIPQKNYHIPEQLNALHTENDHATPPQHE